MCICFEIGYANAYKQIARNLHNFFPNASIEGMTYPPPATNVMLANLASVIFFVGLLLMFAGDFISQQVQIPQVRELCQFISQNKMQVFIGLYVINMIGTNMLSTGAFEIYANDVLIHSKLETGMLIYPCTFFFSFFFFLFCLFFVWVLLN